MGAEPGDNGHASTIITQPYVHLHCHSHYSLLDGACQPGDLVKQAKKLGMNSLAITDHGNLYGAVEFYSACKKEGLNPILGYEAYVAPAHRTDRQTRGGVGNEHSYHLTMLAMNRTGFHNLIKLASIASCEGFYYRPRIDKEVLEQYNEGLIVLSGCAAGELSTLILGDRKDDAQRLIEWYAKIFGDRFYLEIQDNGLQLQKDCAAGTIDLANRMGLPLVATCDTHYLCSDDAEAHEVLLCINTNKTMSDPKRMQYGSNEFYLKSPAEMYQAFPTLGDAVGRSQEIANRIDIDLDFKKRYFPVFTPPENKTDQDFLRELCAQKMRERFPQDGSEAAAAQLKAAQDRLDWELGVICRQGYASYFLIVWDFVNFSLENGIRCGARGSACGALVSFLLGFSNVDPIKYDLLFERFLDPNRAKAPDIDIDFDQTRREEVIEYVKQKYGRDRVCQIITFNTLAARAVLKDVARAYEVPLQQVDKLTKLVPAKPGITLNKALEQVAELRQEVESTPENQRLLRIAQRLEGLARNPGVHAAGIVLGDRPLDEYIPLQKQNEQLITQWEMGILEKIGALKFDFLGLRNLTLLTSALDVIKRSRGIDLDILEIPLDDPKTFQLLQRGETKGVFQLESEGMRNLLVKMRPDSFFDIIAVLALYRPGPLGGGMVDTYINVKHGRQKAEYDHPVMENVLGETYGVMVYQEQIMRILNRLGDIELADSYLCIKAIGAKRLEDIAGYKGKFVEGCGKKGLNAEKAAHIFELIEFFAGYGFNKSHSTAYALIAYQTAFLKAHYTGEFMAALLSSETDKTDLLVEHVDDCRRMGIEVCPPDINESDVNFLVHGNLIRFGLAAIKGVGEVAVTAVVAERQARGNFKDLYDFCERLDSRVVSRSCIEALIKAGALDCLKAKRASLMAGLPSALQNAQSIRGAKEAGQGLLFGGDDDPLQDLTAPPLPEVAEWPDQERLQFEKEVLGIYLSSHPLADKEQVLRLFRTHRIEDVKELAGRTEIVLGGMITQVRLQNHRTGKYVNERYARFMFTDLTGTMSSVMFASAFRDFSGKVTDDRICFIKAEVDKSREEPGLIVLEVIDLDFAPKVLSGNCVIRLTENRHTTASVDAIRRILQAWPGTSPVWIEVMRPSESMRVGLKASDEFMVSCENELAKQLETVLGPDTVRFTSLSKPRGKGGPPRNGYHSSNGNGNGVAN